MLRCRVYVYRLRFDGRVRMRWSIASSSSPVHKHIFDASMSLEEAVDAVYGVLSHSSKVEKLSPSKCEGNGSAVITVWLR
eukprot:5054659-Pleurochrysis_carterae.AAC.5